MGRFLNCVAAAFLCVTVAFAQKSSTPIQRIICTPPTTKILKRVKPIFPTEAIARHIFGPVSVEVAIDKNGKPTTITVLNGDPILAEAVVKAVRQWRWKPLRLNGQPVELNSTITVNFEPRL